MRDDLHYELLSQAAGKGLSEFDFELHEPEKRSVLEELYSAGYLSHVDVISLDSPTFTGIRITMSGRAKLKELREERYRHSFRGRLARFGARLGAQVTTIIVSVIVSVVSSAVTAWIVARYVAG